MIDTSYGNIPIHAAVGGVVVGVSAIQRGTALLGSAICKAGSMITPEATSNKLKNAQTHLYNNATRSIDREAQAIIVGATIALGYSVYLENAFGTCPANHTRLMGNASETTASGQPIPARLLPELNVNSTAQLYPQGTLIGERNPDPTGLLVDVVSNAFSTLEDVGSSLAANASNLSNVSYLTSGLTSMWSKAGKVFSDLVLPEYNSSQFVPYAVGTADASASLNVNRRFFGY